MGLLTIPQFFETIQKQYHTIQYILLHKTTNNMFIANEEIIKSTNGEIDCFQKYLQPFNNV